MSNETKKYELSGCGIVVLLFCTFLGFVLFAAVCVAIWSFANDAGGGGGDDDDDRRRVDATLVEDIDRAMPGEEGDLHALYFSKVCLRIANTLETDQDAAKEYTTRQEAADLVGRVGYFATAGIEGVDYPRLPRVFEDAIADALGGLDKDGELPAGDMTPQDWDRYIETWRELADAFKEAS